jgi:meso-butanediol dehydrogenase / (S,S)-butanediol dehydrogenase / diacetyl reductase
MSDRAVAVVTGAASGIGRAIAGALASEFRVVGLDLKQAAGGVPVVPVDVTRRADIERAAVAIGQEYGPVAVLVNNAGLLTMNRFLDLTDEEWRRVFDVNVYGVYAVSQVFARLMAKGKGGRIVNVASLAGKIPLPDQAHYCASKAAVIMLTRVMAAELAPMGIRAFAVCPGAVDTEMFGYCLSWTAERDGRSRDELLREWLAPSRLGRLIEPAEVAGFVRYLATGPVDALTSHALSFDGGVAPW